MTELWTELHLLALEYPSDIQEKFRQWKGKVLFRFKSIGCLCNNHLRMFLVHYPVENYITNKDIFFNWSVDLHNFVNNKLNKKIITYDEAREIYTNLTILPTVPSSNITL